MHPILRDRNSQAGYALLWLVLMALMTAMVELAAGVTLAQAIVISIPLCVFYAFVCLTPWYVCRALALDSTPWWKLGANHIGAAILATALWVAALRLLAQLLELEISLNPVIPYVVVIGILLYLLSVALHYVLLALQASREAAVQARDAELRALKSQINPHFLFNCLNSISALTSSNPAKARDMCVLLSDFLRNTLGLGERSSITWREELDLARTYLEVERVRFGSRLNVEMEFEEACADCKVPPLVLQPLIENAIKHGIASLVEGGTIRLTGKVEAGLLAIQVENPFDPEAPAPRRSGLGLRNVRTRLQTRFGTAARLHATSNENMFRAEMTLPFERN